MFIDASALVSVLTGEPDRNKYIELIAGAMTPLAISPLVRMEAVLALMRVRQLREKPDGSRDEIAEQCGQLFDELIVGITAEEIAITPEIGRAALSAYARFGKGFGHPAKLNLVDCFSYACAKSLGAPLLYKGDDFAKTDLA